MAAAEEPKFEHAALEKDIEKLAVEIRERRIPGAEMNRGILKAVLHEYTGVPAPAPSNTIPTATILPNYLTSAPAEVKYEVEKLIDIAWHKGVRAAVQEARKQSPLILDAFHDALTDKLYKEFKQRKII